MDLIRRLFAKSAPRGLFSFVFPRAPASLSNPAFPCACRGRVYACVKRKADSIATMELSLQQRSGGEWKEVTAGPGMAALALPTSVDPFLSSDGLCRGTSSFLNLAGNAFRYVAHNAKRPAELWQLDPTKVEVIRDERNFIPGWVYRGSSVLRGSAFETEGRIVREFLTALHAIHALFLCNRSVACRIELRASRRRI